MDNRLGELRIYVDTCVFGGMCDEEFTEPTQAFFEQVRLGRFKLVVSALVEDELAEAPRSIQDCYDDMLPYCEVIYPTADSIRLQNAYLDAGILTPKWADDALHVATATVSGCSLIVSWNFKHIVHFDRIPKYNAVNTLLGYGNLAIHTPAEVIAYEEDV